MKFETIKAISEIVRTYVKAIEDTNTRIPEEIVDLISTDPFKACEALNDFALTCNAISSELDDYLARIYEVMDAEDARSEAAPELCANAIAAYAGVHREIVEPEPEPEPEFDEAADDSEVEGEMIVELEPSEDNGGSLAAEETASEKKSRTKRRGRKKAVEETAEAEQKADGESAAEASTASEEGATDKPAKKTRRTRSRAAASEEPDAEPKATKAKAAKKSTKAKAQAKVNGAEGTSESAKPEAKEAASNTKEAIGENTLTVEQATAILGMSRPSLLKRIESGELPAYKQGRSWRISAEAVLNLANQ